MREYKISFIKLLFQFRSLETKSTVWWYVIVLIQNITLFLIDYSLHWKTKPDINLIQLVLQSAAGIMVFLSGSSLIAICIINVSFKYGTLLCHEDLFVRFRVKYEINIAAAQINDWDIENCSFNVLSRISISYITNSPIMNCLSSKLLN